MGTFNIWTDILVPIKNVLDGDQRIAGRGIRVFYDRTIERVVEPNIMPAINYFLEAPWSDESIGVGAFSVQNRKFTIRVGIALWISGTGNRADEVDYDLHMVGSDLMDIFRQREYWDQTKQIALAKEITLDFDHQFSTDGLFVATQKLSVFFEQFAP